MLRVTRIFFTVCFVVGITAEVIAQQQEINYLHDALVSVMATEADTSQRVSQSFVEIEELHARIEREK
jgi:invasion protein IalB